MERWQNIHNVVVVGLGITGLSVVKHLRKTQPQLTVKVIDTRDNPPGAERLPEQVELHRGGWNTQWLAEADLVVTNPGIALATPEIQTVLAKGTPVVGDIELFAWAVNKPVVAITGSNGKSTVTDLTGVMAKAAGLTVGVGGNIGVPALELLEQDADLYVLELSSFQLETTSSLKLKAAAFLNLSEDHMDRYEGMADYRAAKLRIFDHAELAVVNRDDQETYPEVEMPVVTFGSDEQAYGLEVDGSRTWLFDHGQRVIASDELKLVGKHNLANALVVLALLKAAGVDYHNALNALKNYTGLTHRCQVVADNRGVKWVNDSKATNIASTMAALSGLESTGKLYLLVGGVGKGADFTPLKPIFATLNLQLCCFGLDGDDFMPLHESAIRFNTMEDVIQQISSQLKSGDMVMLSPACASFDQFDNFMARGDAFAVLAQKYA
ncbi:UDP-N-acetylmuramoyl-L-alanine--D-glutamate ligase [Vibrio parahaemolyticus]|uniref:UDP-N-acetylmuramoyl-L-alanine--D-glutamate ligase n=1 Tax=Vibrio parahaemolyticus TaxID=670 RepID=UPI00112390F0|nr:UDP-N-acetylmuramoyl-L-alanine--D-glutamate ligase [Vibrio parahaemolyticus]EID4379640.1 UDP-N-acetylmuramoyl-L-alanine--D-glutamate ligase [Vibrio parahaemolyticus]MBE3976493.1 UDP-N-acetylmuramoyl-L-alanine--D-glutamate ligase [Vibrio parahaemolyticus]MCR9645113.1 UDP-N-acetylmuramoyl-L-alanine--D-glutamate ligase [Vibrio parahaemolyticus]MCR9798972.1 UDP-N-acetylmuramoyl-L-alanine--D-glutamate ligase [Vibrio parahaemolyticus]MDF4284292.1 UDP-N-acetylmuramoyl-L-alanine--D-glutamate ligase